MLRETLSDVSRVQVLGDSWREEHEIPGETPVPIAVAFDGACLKRSGRIAGPGTHFAIAFLAMPLVTGLRNFLVHLMPSRHGKFDALNFKPRLAELIAGLQAAGFPVFFRSCDGDNGSTEWHNQMRKAIGLATADEGGRAFGCLECLEQMRKIGKTMMERNNTNKGGIGAARAASASAALSGGCAAACGMALVLLLITRWFCF
jgi:hypothetical protein